MFKLLAEKEVRKVPYPPFPKIHEPSKKKLIWTTHLDHPYHYSVVGKSENESFLYETASLKLLPLHVSFIKVSEAAIFEVFKNDIGWRVPWVREIYFDILKISCIVVNGFLYQCVVYKQLDNMFPC